jgi:BASS family bile acid:Na+ symporter
VFLGTDNELLSLSVLPATAVGILTLPFYASLAGLPGLEPARLALELLAVVGTAMGGAVLIRLFVPLERVERHAPALDVGALLLMVTVAIGVTDGLASLILAEPAVVVEAFVVTAVLSLVLQALGWLAFYRLGARVAGSVALVNGLRNMALLLGLLIGQVDASLQLLLVLGQLQLFLLPSVMRPLYRRLGVAPDQTAAP